MNLGTAASPGIAIGRALVIREKAIEIDTRTGMDPLAEMIRLEAAIDTAKANLKKVSEQALVAFGPEKAEIFEAHLMMLEDPEMLDQVKTKIQAGGLSAEAAYQAVSAEFIQLFEGMSNAYMKERAADVRDVSARVLRSLLGIESVDLSCLDSDAILVGHDFTPSDTATMNRKKVLGLLTDIGGRTSHTAILARTLEIPAVVGTKTLSREIQNGDLLIVDGYSGQVHVNPNESTLEQFRAEQARQIAVRQELNQLRGMPSTTLDGHSVELSGNIGSPKDVDSLIKGDAEGVGLFRTEFIYMDRTTLPSEEEQFKAYRDVLSGVPGQPVIIRTLDIGGDKSLPYLPIDPEMNPFLGYRAIRICLDRQDLFKTQLRALLRASVFGKLKIMFPMISSLEELLAAKKILNETREELLTQGVQVAENIPVGMMIEVPSAAMIADVLARHCDFFSIGTNDLIQYTCAVDRMNEKIHHLYSSCNPGVLRLVNQVIQGGHAAGIPVGMCGEVAGELPLVPVLLGMGLDEFSMSAGSILKVRRLIRSLRISDARALAKQVLLLSSAHEIDELTKKFIAN